MRVANDGRLPLAGGEAGVEWFQGVRIYRGLLASAEQRALLTETRAAARDAPARRLMTPWGRRMSVAMTNAGTYGWVSDRQGYRYVSRQPDRGVPWPPIPPGALAVWRRVAGYPRPPQCCLINHYKGDARMGLHRDADEADLDAPVVSISLGDPARFRVGGLLRKDPTRSTILRSGDVAVLAGQARLAYHGIDSILHGESDLLSEGGRVNLTLRIVDRPED